MAERLPTSQETGVAAQYSFYVTSDINSQVQFRVDRLLGRIPAYNDPELAPGGTVRPSALQVTAVLSDTHSVVGSSTPTRFSEAAEEGCFWDSWITFPPKYRDLGPTAQIAVTVWEVREGKSGPVALGGTTMPLFSKKGRLKSGYHTLKLWLREEGDAKYPSSTPGKVPAAQRGNAGRVERAMKKYQRGEFQSVPWLDTLAVRAARQVLSAELEVSLTSSGCMLQLIIELPSFPLPVLYHDMEAPSHLMAGVAIDAASVVAAGAVVAGTKNALSTALPGTSGSGVMPSPAPATEGGREDEAGRLILLHDPEVGKESPAEAKAQKLARNTGRGLIDTGLRPNTEERRRIDAVLASPPGQPLDRENRELLWRFRFTLVTEGRALTRFLKCVDWSDAAEAAQAVELMRRWSKISVADALELLSPDYPVEAVRAHGVIALRGTNDEELLHYLLQLVQALRFEPLVESRLGGFLIARARRSAPVASALYWYLCAELNDPTFGERVGQIQDMLLAKSTSHTNDITGDASLAVSGASTVAQDCIPLQVELVARLRHLSEAVRAVRSADRKTEALRGMLAPGAACADLCTFQCPCPLDPGVTFLGLIPQECHVFKSKVSPIRFTFKVALGRGEGVGDGSQATSSGGVSAGAGGLEALAEYASETATLSLIYKRGDDLRQDQLILQLISLMDRLLKREHVDLRITAYQVLPTRDDEGLIEFVTGAVPLSQVMREHGSIHRFLTRYHPDPKGPYGLNPGVLSNYVRSCAGCVVVTHVLGIGDRHMDNLMLTTDGRLFHIDFGYVLGRDPKFNIAPLVLNRMMVDGMGGAESPHYKEFVQLCGEAFNILRQSANLLLSLVHLMAGSSIPDIRSDPEKALLKVQERFRLDLTDEGAAVLMDQMLTAAQAAFMPRVAEVQHSLAQRWK